MRREITALGAVLILAGLLALSVQGIPYEQIKYWNVGDEVKIDELPYKSVNDSWIIPPTSFKEGEVLRVEWRYGWNWAYPPTDGATVQGTWFDYLKVFEIRVVDAANRSDYTEFDIIIACPSPDQLNVTNQVYQAAIEVMHQGPLLVGVYIENTTYTIRKFTEVIGGIVRRDGNYTIETEGPDGPAGALVSNGTDYIPVAPPANLYLYKAIVERTYPYKFLLVASPVTLGIGIVTFVWGAKKGKSKVPRKKLIQSK